MCEACSSDAIHKRCVEKIDHFAHQAPHSPAVGGGETELHYACKTEILADLQKTYPSGKWQMERCFPAKPEKKLKEQRPDLSGYIHEIPVVIENQASALTIPRILARMKDYTRRRCFVLWVVPLKNQFSGELFLPRLYERYFHSIYFGRTYYLAYRGWSNVSPHSLWHRQPMDRTSRVVRSRGRRNENSGGLRPSVRHRQGPDTWKCRSIIAREFRSSSAARVSTVECTEDCSAV